VRDLTDRQRLVLQLVADGLTSKGIAEMLDCSPQTVRTHRDRILKRLGVHSTGQAVAVAIRSGVIP
jgi:DNA-binding NarL/FixJ family response regulator